MISRLTKETKELIKTDSDLFSLVSKALNIQPSSVNSALATNNKRLIEYPVLKVIADYTGKTPDSLIEEYDDSTETADKVSNIKLTA